MQKLIGRLFVLSAPTGAGKTTIAKAVLAKIGAQLPISKVITYTTRPPRPQEINGKDYHFVAINDFLSQKNAGFFLETTVYDKHWYGSPKSILSELSTGKSFLIVTDLPGAHTIKAKAPETILIWLDVPNKKTLIERLTNRGGTDQQALQQRIDLAQQEMAQEKKDRFFAHHVMNETIDDAAHTVTNIIYDAIHPDKKRTTQQ